MSGYSDFSEGVCILQVFAIEFSDFAIEFAAFAIEFVPFAIEFVGFAIGFVLFAIEFVGFAIEFVAFAVKFVWQLEQTQKHGVAAATRTCSSTAVVNNSL